MPLNSARHRYGSRLVADDKHPVIASDPPATPTETCPAASSRVRPAADGGRTARRLRLAEHTIPLGLALLVFVVHDVKYVLRQSFWNDEAWVAVTTRFPLTDLPDVGAPTPIGWLVALRLVTPDADQTSRLLPLAFAAAAVMIAYSFGRGLDWRRRDLAIMAGLLAGAGVLLAPAMLVRNDLKQYTADACFALLTLALAARLERAWTRGGLALLSIAVWGGMLFSHTVAFVGVAAFAAICIVQLARRDWRRLIEAVVAAAVTGVLMLAVYVAFDARGATPGLISFWRAFYVPIDQGTQASAQFVAARLAAVTHSFGLGPWWLALPLVVAGIVSIFRLGRPATALAILMLGPVMLAASALRKYPFLDERTSTFLFVVTIAVAAVGVAGLCALVRPRLKGTVTALVAVVALLAILYQSEPYVRAHTIPKQDIGPQSQYVAEHAATGDVVLVNFSGNWGFSYYWPVGQPSRRASHVTHGYQPYFPDQPHIVAARNRTPAGVEAALDEALDQAQQRDASRIWLVRAHVNAPEQEAWNVALRRKGLTATPIADDGLTVIQLR
jgi:hypothetical protein